MSQIESHNSFHDPLEALEKLLSHFDNRGVIIGGIAVSLLGQARFTEDLDAMILLSTTKSPNFYKLQIKKILSHELSKQ